MAVQILSKLKLDAMWLLGQPCAESALAKDSWHHRKAKRSLVEKSTTISTTTVGECGIKSLTLFPGLSIFEPRFQHRGVLNPLKFPRYRATTTKINTSISKAYFICPSWHSTNSQTGISRWANLANQYKANLSAIPYPLNLLVPYIFQSINGLAKSFFPAKSSARSSAISRNAPPPPHKLYTTIAVWFPEPGTQLV